ncbi:MAG: hypothetical protein ACFB02_11045 [Mastigocoleus sp.]
MGITLEILPHIKEKAQTINLSYKDEGASNLGIVGTSTIIY